MGTAPSQPRRIVTRLLVFLLLFLTGGAIVNVAVAWGAANLLEPRREVTRTIDRSGELPVTTEHSWPADKTQGWPLRSFSERVPTDSFPATVTVIKFTNAKLAYGPIWPGFAINTIFYAAILWLLWTTRLAPGAIRRMRRKQRGLCIHCGYDLRGAPPDSPNCPECGEAVGAAGELSR